MAQFSYIDTGGKMQNIEAADAKSALSSAPNIMKGSGVMAAPAPQATTPSVNPNTPVSSATYMQNQQVQTAVNNAMNPPQPKPLSAQQQRVKDFLGTDDDAYISSLGMSDLLSIDKEANARRMQDESYKKAEAQLQTSYNADLAAQNAQYGQLSSQLAQGRENDIAKAKVTAAQLNPYSGANTDENNYTMAVNAKYNQLQADLDLKAQQARAALSAGNAKGYQAIQESMAQSYQQGVDSIQDILGGMEKSKLQKEQFNLSMEKQDEALKQTGFNNFMSLVKTLGSDDTLRSSASNFLETGKADANISSYLEQAGRAGLSSAEAASIIVNGTDKAKMDEAKQWKMQQDVINAQTRLAQSQEKIAYAQINAQRDMAVAGNVAATSQALLAKGILPNSPEYALGLASATGASKQFLSTAEIRDMQGSINLLTELGSVKSDISAIMGDSQVKNFITTKAGKDAQSIVNAKDIAVITARMNSLAPSIAKNLNGQVGSLSDRDIASALSALPSGASSNDINAALYNIIIGSAKNNLVSKTTSYSASNRNVAGYVPQINYALEQATPMTSVAPSKGQTSTGIKYEILTPKK